MGQYPIWKDWLAKADKLQDKMKDNAFGTVEMGIQFKGAAFGSAVEPEVLEMKLGDHDGLKLKGGGQYNDWSVYATAYRHTYTDHKEEFNELLEAISVKVDEKLSLSDSILFAMVADQIPLAVANRMDGTADIDAGDHSAMMKMAIEADLLKYEALVVRAMKKTPIQSIDISLPLSVNFITEPLDWAVQVNVEKQEGKVPTPPTLTIGPQIIVDGSVTFPALPRYWVVFLMHRKEIEALVERITQYLEKAKSI